MANSNENTQNPKENQEKKNDAARFKQTKAKAKTNTAGNTKN